MRIGCWNSARDTSAKAIAKGADGLGKEGRLVKGLGN